MVPETGQSKLPARATPIAAVVIRIIKPTRTLVTPLSRF
jgi:hypothetical protein